MGDSVYFGSKRPRLQHLVRPGGVSGEIRDLRSDVDEALVFMESDLGISEANSNIVRYVDSSANAIGSQGSLNKPYPVIQEAIDELEELNTPDVSKIIYVEPGTYEEALVIHQDRISIACRTNMVLGTSRGSIFLEPPEDEWCLTLTNATPESLAAYDISGDYGDLVNQGDAGPRLNSFSGIFNYRLGTASAGMVRCLGVKGDDSPDTTRFGAYLTFSNIYYIGYDMTPYCFYVRNTLEVGLWNCKLSVNSRMVNTFRISSYFSDISAFEVVNDETDPHGSTYYLVGLSALNLYSSALDSLTGVTLTKTGSNYYAAMSSQNSHLGLRDSGLFNPANRKTIAMSGTGLTRLEVQGSEINMNLDLSGNTRARIRASSIAGDISLGSGPEMVDLEGSTWSGTLTDPDEKLAIRGNASNKLYSSVQTSAATARNKETVRYDVSGGTFQIDAPATPILGDSFAVKEIANDATNVTVSGNGIDIEHPVTGVVASTAVFGVARIGVTWEYDGSDWIIP